MKIAVCYVYPLVQSPTYFPLAKRFAQTLRKFPGGSTPYELHLLCNGANPMPQDLAPFEGIPHRAYGLSNAGWDIGAYQWAVDHVPCDLMVCLGAPVHFYRTGWLDRMAESFLEYGCGLYGIIAYSYPNLHIRTTAFWCSPELIASYPDWVGTAKSSRYGFEHGPRSFTRHVIDAGFTCAMVTWRGVYGMANWPHDPWAQPWTPDVTGPEDILVFDQHIHR